MKWKYSPLVWSSVRRLAIPPKFQGAHRGGAIGPLRKPALEPPLIVCKTYLVYPTVHTDYKICKTVPRWSTPVRVADLWISITSTRSRTFTISAAQPTQMTEIRL